MNYELKFLLSLSLTIISETVTLFFVAKYFLKIQLSVRRIIFLGVFCSFSTLPYLWFILPIFIKSYFQLALIGEAIVIIIESIIYYFVLKVNLKKALCISLVCNIVSFLVGLAINLF